LEHQSELYFLMMLTILKITTLNLLHESRIGYEDRCDISDHTCISGRFYGGDRYAEVLPVSHGECRGSLCSSYPTLTKHRILRCDQHDV
jgi:hypothetical protein